MKYFLNLLSRLASWISPEPRYRNQQGWGYTPKDSVKKPSKIPIGGTGAAILRTPSGDRYGVSTVSQKICDNAAKQYVSNKAVNSKPTKTSNKFRRKRK